MINNNISYIVDYDIMLKTAKLYFENIETRGYLNFPIMPWEPQHRGFAHIQFNRASTYFSDN